MKNRNEDIASMCGMLNWRGSTPFGELCGVFPMKFLTDLDRNTTINFSYDIPIKVSTSFPALLDFSLAYTFLKANISVLSIRCHEGIFD